MNMGQTYVAIVILLVATYFSATSAGLLPGMLASRLEAIMSSAQQQQTLTKQSTTSQTAASQATSLGVDPYEYFDYEFSSIAQQHKAGKGAVEKQCPAGCEQHGNCNKELGRCECAVGYAGPDCSQPLWPACKLHPNSTEMFCGTWHPKSCDCLRQCAKHICPEGPRSCEFEYDMASAKCFERPAGLGVEVGGEVWDGGSSLPAETEEGVKYYLGVPQKDGRYIGVVREIERSDFVDLEPHAADGWLALPLADCPDSCHYQGGCVRRKSEETAQCMCHYGFAGPTCGEVDVDRGLQHTCWNNCQGRGVCRRGFCHCQPGWWGKDCGRATAYAAHSARRLVHKLRVYAYDLPWEVAYQPEYHLGWRDHDQIYMAWKVFGEMFLNDTVVRTENPWEANMFYIPAMSYAYSSNLGDTRVHATRVINYVKQTWPFFNRTKGLDHFMWLTNDRGACEWPGGSHPDLANVIKVVHFAWHHPPGKALPAGWTPSRVQNKHWGCFHPLRDISAAPYWLAQADTAAQTYGLKGAPATFDINHIPQETLLFFAGGIRAGEPDYSNGVRQALHRLFGSGQHPNITIQEGGVANYSAAVRGSKFCVAPSGHGWGIRLSQYMAQGCVPVIIQDDTYQAWEDLLPYSEFSVRIPQSRISAVADLLAAISDEDYLFLRAGVAMYWRAFVWDKGIGGMAYDYMISSLQSRMVRLHAREYHPLLKEQPVALSGRR